MSLVALVNTRPYTAAALSLAMPGLGQIYLGQGELGVLLYILPNLVVVLCFLFADATGALASLLFLFAAYFFACIKAYYDAKVGAQRPRKAYNHPMFYLLLITLHLAFTVWLTNPHSYLGRNVVFRTFRAATDAMAPALLPGDLLISFRRPHRPFDLARGTMVVLQTPSGHFEIRRIVALPGDKVQLYQGRLFRDGVPLRQELEPDTDGPLAFYREYNQERSYLVAYDDKPSSLRGGMWQVQPGTCLALPDHRTNALESGAWAPIKQDAIVGEVAFILYPRGSLTRFGPVK